MKKAHIFCIFALASLSMLFSCAVDDTNDTSSSDNVQTTYIDYVSMKQDAGKWYFVGGSVSGHNNGSTYIPDENLDNADNIKAAVIQFEVLEDLSSDDEYKYKIHLVNGPVKIDAPLCKSKVMAEADSTHNDSIIELTLVDFIDNRYLIAAAQYYMTNRMPHYLTLCYASDESFIKAASNDEPDTLRFFLRHNADDDVATTNTSYNYSLQGDLDSYLKAYDVHDIINDVFAKSEKKSIYVEIAYKALSSANKQTTIKYCGFQYPFDVFEWKEK